MIKTKLPTENKIREEGVFLGISMGIGEMFCEVFRYNNKNFVMLDYYNPKTNKVTYVVAVYYGRIGKLVGGFSAEDGSFYGDARYTRKQFNDTTNRKVA